MTVSMDPGWDEAALRDPQLAAMVAELDVFLPSALELCHMAGVDALTTDALTTAAADDMHRHGRRRAARGQTGKRGRCDGVHGRGHATAHTWACCRSRPWTPPVRAMPSTPASFRLCQQDARRPMHALRRSAAGCPPRARAASARCPPARR
ncbi:MAG: hypothetical protein R2854_03495 [Caldilineaceae bacterium]